MQENREPIRKSEYNHQTGNLLDRQRRKWTADDAGSAIGALVNFLVLMAGILLYMIGVTLLISLAHIWFHSRTF